MKRLFNSVCLVLAGTVLGWWLREQFLAGRPLPTDDVHPIASVPAVPMSRSVQPASVYSAMSKAPPASPSTHLPDVASFTDLLKQREYGEAVVYYEQSLQVDAGSEALLKPRLEAYLGARVQSCSGDDFVELIELWLETYYADIGVLLLLAEHQRLCSSPEEAARTLQIARTYVLRPGERESISAAVSRLIVTTRERLSRSESWVELLGFYEFLAAIDLQTKASQLHRASIYQRIGEAQRSRTVLLALQEQDDGIDTEWTTLLNHRLSTGVSPSDSGAAPGYEVPLVRRGNHYLVPALINGSDEFSLVIDTGASITTLSRESFDQLGSAGSRYLGTQLFNTANGITQGELYRIESIQLGDTEMQELDIAVLELESSAGFEGLLGMNVLRNYRFRIDQDRKVLHMTPRP